ncbi:hypothetical protein MUB04_16205 [Acinetobacter indicus]|uniref:hypothetical protein n=1 Tax=Acinetobacter TaxID=469 RepID=UPI0015D30ADB|nr:MULTISPECIES: hypothetical protein [Acinetobacter]MCP0918083.1 hypothetical protein [Acinetobacter indicus]
MSNINNKGKKTTVTPGIIGGSGLGGARSNPVMDQIRLNSIKAEEDAKAQAEAKAEEDTKAQAKAEEDAKAQAKAEEDAKAQAKAEEDAKAQAKAEEDAKAQAKAEEDAKAQAEAKAQAKAEEDAKVQAKADAKAQAEADAKVQAKVEKKPINLSDDADTEEQGDSDSDESKRTIKRNVVYRFNGMVDEGRTTQSSFGIDQKLYSELRGVLINNERRLSYKDFYTVVSLAMVNGLIDIDKIMRDLYKRDLIKLKEQK